MVIAQFRLFDKWRFQYSIWATLLKSGAFSRKLLAKQTSMGSFRENIYLIGKANGDWTIFFVNLLSS